jgi:hypothetical protein
MEIRHSVTPVHHAHIPAAVCRVVLADEMGPVLRRHVGRCVQILASTRRVRSAWGNRNDGPDEKGRGFCIMYPLVEISSPCMGCHTP